MSEPGGEKIWQAQLFSDTIRYECTASLSSEDTFSPRGWRYRVTFDLAKSGDANGTISYNYRAFDGSAEIIDLDFSGEWEEDGSSISVMGTAAGRRLNNTCYDCFSYEPKVDISRHTTAERSGPGYEVKQLRPEIDFTLSSASPGSATLRGLKIGGPLSSTDPIDCRGN